MKRFLIYYNYEIKDPDENLIVIAKHETMEVEAETRKSLDTARARERIRQIANEARPTSEHYVCHANYYKIEEIKEDKN